MMVRFLIVPLLLTLPSAAAFLPVCVPGTTIQVSRVSSTSSDRIQQRCWIRCRSVIFYFLVQRDV